MKITINWTPEKKDAVCAEIEKWIIKYGAYSGEKLMQDDDCQIEAPVLLADLVDDIIEPDYNYDDEN